MPSLRQRRGGLYEHRAALYIQQLGYEIIARHVTSRYGEIDILARDGDMLVAIEVKARRTKTFGQSIEALTKHKCRRIVRTMQTYLMKTRQEQQPYRVDLIAFDDEKLQHIQSVDYSL